MKCDFCDNEATVHEVTMCNGERVERHLCEAHAAEQGIAANPVHQIGELIKQYAKAGSVVRQPSPQVCPVCRTSFGEFKQHGLLGCAGCYEIFEGPLGLLIERAHEGAIKHAGKSPKRKQGQAEAARRTQAELAERAQRLAKIRADLDSAVRGEEYERAARLRDELRRLGEGPAGER